MTPELVKTIIDEIEAFVGKLDIPYKRLSDVSIRFDNTNYVYPVPVPLEKPDKLTYQWYDADKDKIMQWDIIDENTGENHMDEFYDIVSNNYRHEDKNGKKAN